ncbi:MAG: Thioredoxin [Candidatus Methanohalarchaeum thermophilum]|uniref:Thioredoxin n=1 Tax=Methanohalarchaeum thermophilum TaxID=1903181 RepID=A0A1Q6DU94_METT1|nr:MAG: Thioredoxin [Candidatus Methanohalarchaeum thermophilum]
MILDWSVLLDEDHEVFRKYGVKRVPTVYLISLDNKILYENVGFLFYKEISSRLEQKMN